MKEVKPWGTNDVMYQKGDYYQVVADSTTVDPTILDFLRGAEGYEVEWCFLPPVNNADASPPGDPQNRGELFFRCIGRPESLDWPAGPYNK